MVEQPKRSVAVVFGAKSTVDPKGSIGTQLSDGRKLADREGIPVVAEFSDERASAYSSDRGPGLAGAMAECERLAGEGKDVSLIVQHSDRLARGDGKSAKHLVEYALWAMKAEITIRSIQDPQTFGDLLYAVVTGQRNHEDSERKSRAVKDGLLRRARDRGGVGGGPRPYGYQRRAWLDAAGRRCTELVIIEEERIIVVRIYDETLAGSSQMSIARRLSREGLRTSTGKKWTQAAVRAILSNRLYCGKVPHNGAVYDGAHEAIVSEETWNDVARMREVVEKRKAPNAKGNLRGSVSGSNNGGGRRPVGRHLLTQGLLRCGTCGAAMVPRTERRRNGTLRRELYLCLGRHRDIKSCGQAPVERAAIDEAILHELSERYLDLEATKKRLQARRNADAALAAEALTQAEAEAARAAERLQRVQRAFQDGIIEPEDYAAQRKNLLAEQTAAEAAVERIRNRKVEVDDGVEEEVLRRLAALRDVALGRLDKAPDLDALRTLLRQTFGAIHYLPFPGKSVSSSLILRPNLDTINRAAIAEALEITETETHQIKTPLINRRPLALEHVPTSEGVTFDAR